MLVFVSRKGRGKIKLLAKKNRTELFIALAVVSQCYTIKFTTGNVK